MQSRPLRDITEQEIDTFWHDGAICLRSIFTREWIDHVAQAIDEDLAHPTRFGEAQSDPGDGGLFFTDYLMWIEKPLFRDYVLQSPAVEVAAGLLRAESVRFFLDGLFVKEPGTERTTPWHHDQALYPVNGDQLVTLWMPVDPVPLTASLRFVRGSHAWGRLFNPYRFKTGRLMDFTGPGFEPTPDIDADPGSYEILAWDVALGNCLAFHDRTLHAAPGTAADGPRRRVLSTRWLGDDVYYAPRKGTLFNYFQYLFEERGARLDDETVFPRLWPR